MKVETINKRLYASKQTAYTFLRIASILTALAGISVVVYGFGFYLNKEEMEYVYRSIDVIYVLFLVNYLLRFLYSFKRRSFLGRTWFEIVFLLIIIINFILNSFLDLGVQETFYQYFVIGYLLVLCVFELIKISTRINLLKVEPTSLFVISFLTLILTGTILLLLPTSTIGSGSIPFIDALFTATSASCVTGLIVEDTGTYFSLQGQLIILGLFQAGGLGIISFATFFSAFFNRGVGIKHQSIVQNIFSSESLKSARGLFKKVILITLLFELIFSVAIFFTWGDGIVFDGIGERAYYSIFHGVSAFCNAGFSLLPNGLGTSLVAGDYILHIIVAAAIIMGGLGFPVIEDLFNPKKLRERLQFPWKDWHLNTKITIYTSLALIITGMIVFYLLENDNTLQEMNFVEAAITSFFQSVTTRTAGFNTIDISATGTSVSIFIMMLMFIGASPASTGGGIKTSTFLILIVSAITTITEKGKVEIGKRTISQEIISKAFTVFSFAIAYNFIAIFFLSIFNSHIDLLDLSFEQFSAFGTVGLSRGVTAELSTTGKAIIIFSMFAGRVGLLTLAVSLSKKAKTTAYRYPNAHLMVG